VSAVVVHWRPGCGFCSMLFRGLDRRGVRYDRRDIWEDGDAAAFVRAHAAGNETVPTVAVGDVVLVNPSADEVVAVARTHAPAAVADVADD
jgi:glutaredoxin-like protein